MGRKLGKKSANHNQHRQRFPVSSFHRRISIDEMKRIAKNRGGECLSNEYLNNNIKLKWRCRNGHEWEAVAYSVKQGSWCPICGGSKQLTIEEMKRMASERKGDCLSTVYKNTSTKLRWRCEKGHEWEAVPGSIRNGSWCPICAGKQPLTIHELKSIALTRGGDCLSNEYIDNKTKLKWRCREGHEWAALPSPVKAGMWCPICSGNIKKTIGEMKNYAKDKGGECLSNEYINALTPLNWRCQKNHEWKATANNILRGHWCPYCAGQGRLTIDDLKKIANERGGECLSDVCINSKEKVKWRCKEGHEWSAQPTFVKSGGWCPICGMKKVHDQQKLTIEEMRDLAKERGGECLSDEYVNQYIKLRWRCKEGHIWEATPGSIKHLKTWCPTCAGNVILTIEQMKTIAQRRGGLCLSNEYINNKTNLRWKCKEGHEWVAVPSMIEQGQWCPICSKGISERICRKIFEELFQKDFPPKHPKWLINPITGSRMELDGYCVKLKIAFEYQGEQHYKEKKRFFHKINKYEDQIKRDILKKELCKKNGVTLLIIPHYIPFNDLAEYIINICIENDINISNISLALYDYKTLDGVYNPEKLRKLQDIASARGGLCLSNLDFRALESR